MLLCEASSEVGVERGGIERGREGGSAYTAGIILVSAQLKVKMRGRVRNRDGQSIPRRSAKSGLDADSCQCRSGPDVISGHAPVAQHGASLSPLQGPLTIPQ